MNPNADTDAAVDLVVHLQKAALELIGAARAALTVIERVVADAAETGRAAAARPAPERPSREDGAGPHPHVEHIRVS